MKNELEINKHYYLEEGRIVFTALYHLQRGHCCGSKGGCRHCPFTKPPIKGNKETEIPKK
jgi:hypothetical protein